MSVFGLYARYYDLLYRDKDYAGEAMFVGNVIRRYAPDAGTLLDLGCGTGRHARCLVDQGFTVHGVDLSVEMLEQARRESAAGSAMTFSEGDVRTVRTDSMYDAVTSLFHVISYMQENVDLDAAMETAAVHLRPGGVFLFDFWYGPAVLTQGPERRELHLEDAGTLFDRIAEPVLLPNRNQVDVSYTVTVTDRESGVSEDIRERHRMRYLFRPEVERLLAAHGFEAVECAEFLTGREPGVDTWNVYVAARRVGGRRFDE